MEAIINVLNTFLATFFVLFVPPFIACLIVVVCKREVIKDDPEHKDFTRGKELVRYTFSLHTNKGLSSQGLFWLAIAIPFFYFFFLGLIAWNGYRPRLDAEGFKTFISISALPLGVLSLALPLSVSVARFHSSKQTAKQIEMVGQKNNVDLFHSHRKEFFSYFTQVGETVYSGKLTGKNYIHPRLHKLFFVGSPEKGTPVPNEEMFSEIRDDLFALFYYLDAVIHNNNKEMTYDFYVKNFCPRLYSTALKLGLVDIISAFKTTSVEYAFTSEGDKFRTVGECTEDSVVSMRYIYNFYNNLCDFAGYLSSQDDVLAKFGHLISSDSYRSDKNKIIEEIVSKLESEKLRGIKTNTHIPS